MRRAGKWLQRGAEIIGVALFAGLFCVFILGVVMRYLVGRPLVWADEVCVILLVWSMFWAAAFVLRENEHVTFDLLYERVPLKVKRMFVFTVALGAGALFLWCLPATVSYVTFLWREVTPSLRLRLDYVYFCFVIFLAAVALRYLWRALGLARPGWRERL